MTQKTKSLSAAHRVEAVVMGSGGLVKRIDQRNAAFEKITYVSGGQSQTVDVSDSRDLTVWKTHRTAFFFA